MNDAVTNLLVSRQGHFLLESGHHGDLWLDLDALFWQPISLSPVVGDLAERVRRFEPEAVCGPLWGGALLGYLVAERLGLPFVPAERGADGPGSLFSAQYQLPTALRQRLHGLRVAVIDDVINAGSAVRSTLAAVRASGGVPVGVASLLRLGGTFLPYAASADLPVDALSVLPNTLWTPDDCPLCARGVPVDDWR